MAESSAAATAPALCLRQQAEKLRFWHGDTFLCPAITSGASSVADATAKTDKASSLIGFIMVVTSRPWLFWYRSGEGRLALIR